MVAVIAIDGPAGSGKSVVSYELAKRLGITYLDTGAIYRSLALESLKQNIKSSNVIKLIELANNIKISFENINKKQIILVNNVDVTNDIRTEKIGHLSSIIGVHLGLREKLCFLQRKLCCKAKKWIIVEGRDIGTVVFPNALVKIFLQASKEERANRRAIQLGLSSYSDKNKILKNIIERDKRDMMRKFAPLKIAYDAKIVDTTDILLEDLINILESYIIMSLK